MGCAEDDFDLPAVRSSAVRAQANTLTLSLTRSFLIHPFVQALNRAVLVRLQIKGDETGCTTFPVAGSANRCLAALKAHHHGGSVLEIVRFSLPTLLQGSGFPEAQWESFYAVVHPATLGQKAFEYWRDTGDGISSRHAEYCHARLDYLGSTSSNDALRTQPLKSYLIDAEASPAPVKSSAVEKLAVQSFIARLATSEKPGQQLVSVNDVFLYPGGMAAIHAVSRALASLSDHQSEVVGYGRVLRSSFLRSRC